MVNYKNKIVPVTCIILLVLLLLSECTRRTEKVKSKANFTAVFDTVKYYQNKIGTQSATIKSLLLDRRSFENLILKKDNQLKQLSKEFSTVKNVVKFKTVTRLDTIYLPFKQKIECNFKVEDTVTTKHYSFKYEIDSVGLRLSHFALPNQTTIITGYKRKWPLGKQIITTDVTNSNPYIKTENILSAEVTVPEPWYKKWYVWLAAGLITGAMVK
jgi:hypothetical protein